ncbi:MAG: hypothetical protein KAJ98_13425, partial [Spirochaetaceae bacterium]|nr:hypothetical protein [Spirochaetaceae bacterium]
MPRYFSERGNSHIEVIERIHSKYGDRANIQIQKTIPASGIPGLFGKVQYEYRGYLRTGDETKAMQKNRDNETRAAILASVGKNPLPPIKSDTPDTQGDQFVEVLQELRELKGQLAISASTPPPEPFPVLAELSDIMKENDFDRDYIKGILDSLRRNHSAADLDGRDVVHHAAAKLIADSVTYFQQEIPDGPRIFILVGPTGVGKTTTIAKLAAVHGLSASGSDVRIITVDSFRIGARAQVETYGEIMG